MAKKTTSETVGIRPLSDRVLVAPLSEDENTSPSGIILPESASGEQKDRGTVLAVGEGRRGDDNELVPMSVKVGDKVLFQWGEKVEYGGKEYFLVAETNILAVVV